MYLTQLNHSSKVSILLLMVVMLVLPVGAFAKAGSAMFVLGKVELTTKQGKVLLKKGMKVNEGEKIVTGTKGQVMLKMIDNSKVTIRPKTSLVIKAYKYTKNPKNNKAHMELLAGTFRSITGAIGQTNKKAFKLKMPVGTMGIRGTDFVARYSGEGFYVDVNSGGVSISNENGIIDVSPGDYGHIASKSSNPELVDELPEDMVVIKKEDDSAASPEEEMVALAIRESNGDTGAVIEELVEADLSTKDIVNGATAMGIEETVVIEQIIEAAPDSEATMEELMKTMPDQTGDIVTIGIAKNKVSIEQATTLLKSSGGTEEQINSSVALGNLLAPPEEEDKTEAANGGTTRQKVESTPGSTPTDNAVPATIQTDPQLLPGGGTGGGEDASPS